VRRLRDDAIGDSAAPRPRFELDRSEIAIEREANSVVIQDVLEVT
jgi:hypothetical protein